MVVLGKGLGEGDGYEKEIPLVKTQTGTMNSKTFTYLVSRGNRHFTPKEPSPKGPVPSEGLMLRCRWTARGVLKSASAAKVWLRGEGVTTPPLGGVDVGRSIE